MLEWTEKAPTEDGYYWARYPAYKDCTLADITEIVLVQRGCMCHSAMFREGARIALEHVRGLEWYGPLQQPRDEGTQSDGRFMCIQCGEVVKPPYSCQSGNPYDARIGPLHQGCAAEYYGWTRLSMLRKPIDPLLIDLWESEARC